MVLFADPAGAEDVAWGDQQQCRVVCNLAPLWLGLPKWPWPKTDGLLQYGPFTLAVPVKDLPLPRVLRVPPLT